MSYHQSDFGDRHNSEEHAILIYCYHGFASREYAQIFSDFGFPSLSLDVATRPGHKAQRHRRRAGQNLTNGSRLMASCPKTSMPSSRTAPHPL